MSTVNERAARRWGRKRYFRNVAILVGSDCLRTVHEALNVPYDEDETLEILKASRYERCGA